MLKNNPISYPRGYTDYGLETGEYQSYIPHPFMDVKYFYGGVKNCSPTFFVGKWGRGLKFWGVYLSLMIS
jgi:hypothetical protein